MKNASFDFTIIGVSCIPKTQEIMDHSLLDSTYKIIGAYCTVTNEERKKQGLVFHHYWWLCSQKTFLECFRIDIYCLYFDTNNSNLIESVKFHPEFLTEQACTNAPIFNSRSLEIYQKVKIFKNSFLNYSLS